MSVIVQKTNANPEGDPNGPLDVWLAFDDEGDEASHEANTYFDDNTGRYRVEWYSNAVGLVVREEFDSYFDAQEWLERAGYIDFTVIEEETRA